LSALQERILVVLADMEPHWTLTGGGALAGFHTRHRTTRDLDLVWHGRDRLDELVPAVEERLRGAGLEVSTLQKAPSFHRFEASEPGEMCLIDLVAEPAEGLTPPQVFKVGGRSVRVDGRHEILVNKLCALLGRSELRDLVDVRELLQQGEDLERASRDAPRKDGGYSAVMMAWILKGLRVRAMALAKGLDERQAQELGAFRDQLVERLTLDSHPDDTR
jgi:hypothetical protein